MQDTLAPTAVSKPRDTFDRLTLLGWSSGLAAIVAALGASFLLFGYFVLYWRVAMLATLAFALSGGVAVHLRILRSELVAAMPVIFALMILIAAGRRATPARPLALALAAFLCVLGLENKVQAILLIGLVPVV